MYSPQNPYEYNEPDGYEESVKIANLQHGVGQLRLMLPAMKSIESLPHPETYIRDWLRFELLLQQVGTYINAPTVVRINNMGFHFNSAYRRVLVAFGETLYDSTITVQVPPRGL